MRASAYGTAAIGCLLWGVAAAAPPGGKAEPPERVWLAVTTPSLRPAVEVLAEHRRAEGFRTVVSTDAPGKAIGALSRRPAFVVLVGDDSSDGKGQPWYVPAQRRAFYRWRFSQPAEYASDAAWGDVDGDGMPDVPVGRIPARTPEQAAAIVAKVLAYERRRAKLDDLRLPIWAGTPGYNALTDALATTMLLAGVRGNAPLWAQAWIMSADVSHPLCGWPPDQPAGLTAQLRRGGALVCLIGHGSVGSFHSMWFNSRPVGYSAGDAAAALARGDPGPPLAIIACHCGCFAARRDCLAESLLRMPAGPVAVIAATTESHPLPNAFSYLNLVHKIGTGHERLGEMWRASEKAAYEAQNPVLARLLMNVEGKVATRVDVQRLRADQLLMYALLGDPATRLRTPVRLHGKVQPADGGWRWQVYKPQEPVTLQVDIRPMLPALPPAASPFEREPANRALQAANEAFAFRRLAEKPPGEPWEGTVKEAGVLRFVAVGKRQLYAAAVTLKPPAGVPPGQP